MKGMSKELKPCPFCGYTLSDYEAVAVDGIHDKSRSCILDGFKVTGMEGARKWNTRAIVSDSAEDVKQETLGEKEAP